MVFPLLVAMFDGFTAIVGGMCLVIFAIGLLLGIITIIKA
jgi:hypothetical protein